MDEIQVCDLLEGARLVHFKTQRFKTTRITLRFAMDLKEETAAAFAAVPGLIRYTSADYPSNMLTERKLASLYGASFSAAAGKLADAQILSFTVSAVADRFALAGESIGEECLSFFLAAILRPDLDQNGLFKEKNLAREKRLMLEAIKAEMGDKMAYSLNRFSAAFFADEGAGILATGTPEQVEALQVQQVSAAWRKMLESAQLMVCAVGDIQTQVIKDAVTNAFEGIQRTVKKPHITVHKPAKSIKDIHETQPLEQCKLNLGFCYEKGSEACAKVFNMIFGGSFVSKLTKQVREKLSLCYYCSSSVGINKQVVIVYSGIESSNREAAVEAVCAQLTAIQEAQVSEEEFMFAKQKLKESYLFFDTPYDICRWYLAQILDEHIKTPQTVWKEIENVSLEDVTAFAKTVRLDTVYSLGEK